MVLSILQGKTTLDQGVGNKHNIIINGTVVFWIHLGDKSIDKVSETGAIATMHCFIRRQYANAETDEEAVKTVIYGPSTSN